ncbi:pyridoxamine 5'-phosphate oxidase [Violaceomyces palustris]|uniref:Pyridoxamine 5'-phosphate oxidase n=1 Tax=Violaceomyces palustris TaxID=1673888 RepID=A0ACD0NWA2_9BASI|nr:pyridoxamine 5'-phosphate oxidase [Violaceomyces palustris]
MTDFTPSSSVNMGQSDLHSSAASSSNKPLTSIKTHNQYQTTGLSESDLSPSPISQFDAWFKDALENGVPEPEAMTISTTALPTPSSSVKAPRPSSRVVLLKQVDPKGFLFFTNYDSRKGRELAANPYCSLAFYWKEISRSVRVCGRAERLSQAESKAYFDSRPIGSRIGAWASPQSSVIRGREELEQRVRDKENEFGVPGAAGLSGEKWQGEDKDVPLPSHWGGFRIVPDEIEFWAGRNNRLHDRFRYTRDINSQVDADDDKWEIARLAP